MATARIILPITDALTPSTGGAAVAATTSSGTAPTNGKKPVYKALAYDAATAEYAFWHFRMPSDYLSGGTVTVQFTAAGTTGAVVWKSAAAIGTTGTDLDAIVQNTVGVANAATVPATAGKPKEASVSLTMTNAAAGVFTSIMIGRQSTAAGDTLAVDAYLVGAEFSYTA